MPALDLNRIQDMMVVEVVGAADIGNQDRDDSPNIDNVPKSAQPTRPILKNVRPTKYKDYKIPAQLS